MTLNLTRGEAVIVKHALVMWLHHLPPYQATGNADYASRAMNAAKQSCSDVLNRLFAAEDELAPASSPEELETTNASPF